MALYDFRFKSLCLVVCGEWPVGGSSGGRESSGRVPHLMRDAGAHYQGDSRGGGRQGSDCGNVFLVANSLS